MTSPLVGFVTSSFCNGGTCLEVGHDGDQVHVRNSQARARVATMTRSRWDQLVATAQAEQSLDIFTWFPQDHYGDFAASFTQAEVVAFVQGLLSNETALVG